MLNISGTKTDSSGLVRGQFGNALYLVMVLVLAGCGQRTQINTIDAHLQSAQAYFEQGQFRPAMIEVQNTLQIDNSNEAASVLGAKIRLELGGTRAAYTMLEAFVSGESLDYYSTLAEAYIQSRKYNSALALLLQNSAKFPDHKAELMVLQARAFAGTGNRDRARELFEEALAISPDNARARLGLLSLVASTGDFIGAEEGLNQFLEENPQHLDGLLLLGAVQMRAGDKAAAEITLSSAVAVLPTTDVFTRQRAGVLRALIDLLASQGRSGEALVYQRALDEAFPQNQGNSEKIQEVLASIDNNELDHAEALLSELYQENPDYSAGGALLGLLNYVKGDAEKAEQFFASSVDSETAAEPILKAVALNYYRLNNPGQVVATLRDRVERSDDLLLISLYALAALNIGESDAGVEFMQKAIKIAPQNSALRIRLSQHYASLLPPQHDQALSLLEEGLEQNAASWPLKVHHIRQLLEMERNEDARAAMADLPKPTLDSEKIRFELVMGVFLEELGDFAESEARYQQALALEADNQVALLGLATVAMRANRFSDGIASLERLLEINPNNRIALTTAIQAFHREDRLQAGVDFLNSYNEANDYLSSVVLADFLSQIGAINSASAYVDVLAERNRSKESQHLSAQLNYARAIDFAVSKEFDQARTALFSALAIYPLNPTLLATLTRLEIDDEQLGEAEKIIDDIRQREGNSALVRELTGDMAYAQTIFPVALSNYLDAWPDRPSDALGVKIVAVYKIVKDQQGLEAFVTTWRRQSPSSQIALINDVETFPQNALAAYRDFLQSYPQSPLILNNFALLLLEEGNKSGALTMAERAADLAQDNASILDTYGWVLYQVGQVQEAVNQLSRAAALSPENEAIARNLQEARGAL